MINRTYEEYESVLRRLKGEGDGESFRDILELGAIPDERSLLASKELGADSRKVGINLTLEGKFADFEVRRGDARDLEFDDESFDLILCASMLEHVPDFWRAVDEMKRVLRPGGWLVVSTPGFGEADFGNKFRRFAQRLGLADVFKRGTITMRIHDAPYDYYRFSKYSYQDVILAGLEDVEIWQIMVPPRIYGMGRKP